ncbi:MAG TPA: DUF1554 domain-containing protein [Candidatus Binatia bacterium]|nr:DUF1554 domain-containing protein [Candidatus Binatia bacterium]
MRISYVAAAAIMLCAGSAAAATDAQKCAAAKMKTAGKYAACRLGADAKAQSSGLAADYGKCDAVQQLSWTKAEEKYGGACPTSGDQAAVGGDVTELSECLQSALTGMPETCSLQGLEDDVAACTADLGTCSGGTAAAADVRSGKTFSSASGLGVAGTASEGADVNGAEGSRTATIPAGFYDGDETVTVHDADLAASNILAGVTILGTTGTYAPPTCGNGVLDAGEECDLGTLVGSTCQTFGYAGGNLSCTTSCERTGCYLRIFVTSGSGYEGGLGGVQGGHDICRTHAYAAGHTGVWNAYLSSSTSDARDLLDDRVEFRRMDGTTLIAADRDDLAAGLLENSVFLDEFGQDDSGFDNVWTGTMRDGTADTRNCNEWTDSTSDVTGVGGFANGSSVAWSSSFEHPCHGNHSLYCVESVGTWTPCAAEGATCEFTGLKRVRFGIEGFYVYLHATGSVTCDAATFGEDPAFGVAKTCDYQ